MRFSVLFLLLVLVLLPALASCRRGGAQPPGAGTPAPTTAADVLPDNDPRTLRLHRVDMLVAQWDVAQSGARHEQAAQLARQIQAEVDSGFQDFVRASRGELGTQFQYVGVSALGFSSRREATQALLERLNDRDPNLVGNALIALKIRSDPETPLAPLLRLVRTTAPAPRRYAPLAIANVVEARYRTGRGLDPEMQRTAGHVLSGVVADRDPLVRLHVAKAIGALRTQDSFDLLMILMKDSEIRVRVAAAAGLERLGDARGFPEVIRLLADVPEDVKPVVRDILASYARRLQGRPLTADELRTLDLTAVSWSRWFGSFAERRGIRLDDGRALGAPPGAARAGPGGTPGPSPGALRSGPCGVPGPSPGARRTAPPAPVSPRVHPAPVSPQVRPAPVSPAPRFGPVVPLPPAPPAPPPPRVTTGAR